MQIISRSFHLQVSDFAQCRRFNFHSVLKISFTRGQEKYPDIALLSEGEQVRRRSRKSKVKSHSKSVRAVRIVEQKSQRSRRDVEVASFNRIIHRMKYIYYMQYICDDNNHNDYYVVLCNAKTTEG